MNIKLLEKIGLTSSEIKVYFALMKLGSSSTGKIISEAKINHSKIYLVLQKLKDKGLVSEVIKNKTKYFSAAEPQNLLDYVKIKKKELEQQEEEIEKIIPELQLQHKMGEERQEASVYSGYEGIKSAFNLLLSSLNAKEEYFVFTLYEEANSEQLHRFFLNYHQKRIAKGIKVKLLTMKRFKSATLKKFPKYPLSERRFIDLNLPTGIFIFKDYVMHFIWSANPTIFLIKSKQNNLRYLQFFHDLWKKAEK